MYALHSRQYCALQCTAHCTVHCIVFHTALQCNPHCTLDCALQTALHTSHCISHSTLHTAVWSQCALHRHTSPRRMFVMTCRADKHYLIEFTHLCKHLVSRACSKIPTTLYWKSIAGLLRNFPKGIIFFKYFLYINNSWAETILGRKHSQKLK